MKTCLTALAFALTGPGAYAQSQFFATLNGSNAVPFNASYAWQGVARFALTGDTLTFVITFATDAAALDQARLIRLSGTPLLPLGEAQRAIHEPCNGFDPCDPGATMWSGQLVFTDQQRTEFLAGGISVGLLPSRLFGDTNSVGEITGAIQPLSGTLREHPLTNGQFRLTVTGLSGSNYVVQASSDLNPTNWAPVATNTAPFTFTESRATNSPKRFYRALLGP